MRFIRRHRVGAAVALAALSLAPRAFAEFSFEGFPIQIHGFFSQGFMLSNQNNYLTAKTSEGTFSLTDGGLNVSSQITSRFRVGAQGYVRKIGGLGAGHVTVDWALGDYRVNNWFGVRAGRVKTVLGLYNDTQDVESLHTWALLPQSLYPADLRGFTISHLGADVYGSLHPKRLGTFSYTGYAGKASADISGGLQYGLQSYGYFVHKHGGSLSGADLKWTTPLTGLLVGASFLNSPQHLKGLNINFGNEFRTDATQHTTVFSAQYTRGPWKVEWERSRATSVSTVSGAFGAFGPPVVEVPYDIRGWYAATTYRVAKYLEVGIYHSRFYPNADKQIPTLGTYLPPPSRHIYDQAVTARIDIKSNWDLKVEGHFMDGYGDAGTTRGFYPQDNPNGLQPKTNLLVIRLGFNR